MATTTKKDRHKKPASPNKAMTQKSGTPAFEAKHLVPFILISLYLLVELVPRMDAADVMAPQWLYVSALNFVGLGYIAWNRDIAAALVAQISKNVLTLIYLA